MIHETTILDCYTDEPAGLGVPPFIGVWPRYVAGLYDREPTYLTIDDLRWIRYLEHRPDAVIDPPVGRTHIEALNHTRAAEQIRQVLQNTEQLVIIAGVQTPGKYLSARPGTLREVNKLLTSFAVRKILTGPVLTAGTQVRGGARPQLPRAEDYEELRPFVFDSYEELQPVALRGAKLIGQMPNMPNRVAEIETGRGCPREKGCSFCTEPLKHGVQWRTMHHIAEEVRTLMDLGVRAFRLGKQSCIYSYEFGDPQKIEAMLSALAAMRPAVLHIDNANPAMVDERRTALFVRYLTPGSTAAMGIESFDPEVTKANNLNCPYEMAFEAIRTIHRIGGVRGENGCHALLPGINILLGLAGETPRTLDRNLAALKRIVAEGLLIRRINIRQVVPFPGTILYEQVGQRYLQENRRYYRAFIDAVREEIDRPMLERVFPIGTILRDLCSEVHNGGTTFLRQIGSYPILVAVPERLPLRERFDVRVTGYLRRSLTAERVC
ncbi:MAG TPA: radical SAM protein [Sedimentisphaerales bacterium]|nr:radical SAM protein [Sedimentisphaerales bacterium]HRS09739.1 radical SAM protein [Sedimentisphaerales bacterium]HRV46611.1 radical SAM protein [Sedimentisphaerales bacterium]